MLKSLSFFPNAVLVILLLVYKLTEATGTLSGLVFYANIVGANHTLFLSKESPALSVFIAWLNLDFGIETCFYDGMDAYGKTWLQFVFPVYIWVLVGLIIVVGRFSQKFANLLGNNPISVLATLILLSYAKLLHTFINVVSFTYLEYEDHNRSVWLYDANVDYFAGRHSLPCGSISLCLSLSSLHSLASLWSVVAGHITPEVLLVGQQCQAKISNGCIPCSLQSKASLLAWTAPCASLCSFYSVCLQLSTRPQH